MSKHHSRKSSLYDGISRKKSLYSRARRKGRKSRSRSSAASRTNESSKSNSSGWKTVAIFFAASIFAYIVYSIVQAENISVLIQQIMIGLKGGPSS